MFDEDFKSYDICCNFKRHMSLHKKNNSKTEKRNTFEFKGIKRLVLRSNKLYFLRLSEVSGSPCPERSVYQFMPTNFSIS